MTQILPNRHFSIMSPQKIWNVSLLTMVYITFVKSTVRITTFTRVSAARGSCFSCSMACAEDSTCSGYLLRNGCIFINEKDVHATCLSINPLAPCYRKNNHKVPEPTTVEPTTTEAMATELSTVQAQPETTTAEPTTSELTTFEILTLEIQPSTPIPEGCVQSVRKSWNNGVYVTYHGSDTTIKFTYQLKSIDGDLSDASTKSVSSHYPDFPSDITDMYRVRVGSSTVYMTVIDGRSVKAVEYKCLLYSCTPSMSAKFKSAVNMLVLCHIIRCKDTKNCKILYF